MRVGFRILIFKDGKRLYKDDLQGDGVFERALRYIAEFKYLEATKWLLICEDSLEKYLLLSLTNLALCQREQAMEFMLEAKKFSKRYEINFAIEKPLSREIIAVDRLEVSLIDSLLACQRQEGALQ
ncbi:MAG: hypothetical protein ABDH18_06055 [Aquificaceae bacterium]